MRFFVPAANTDRAGKQQPAENPVFMPPPGQKKYQNPKLYTKISETGIHPQGLKPASGIFGNGSGCRLCKASASPAQTAKRDKPANRPACGIDKALFFLQNPERQQVCCARKKGRDFSNIPTEQKPAAAKRRALRQIEKKEIHPLRQTSAAHCTKLLRPAERPKTEYHKPKSVYHQTRICIP